MTSIIPVNLYIMKLILQFIAFDLLKIDCYNWQGYFFLRKIFHRIKSGSITVYHFFIISN